MVLEKWRGKKDKAPEPLSSSEEVVGKYKIIHTGLKINSVKKRKYFFTQHIAN